MNRSAASRWVAQFRSVLASPFMLSAVGLTLGYGVVLVLIARRYDAPVAISTNLYSYPMWVSTVTALFFFFYVKFLWILIFRKPGKILSVYLGDIRELLTLERVAGALPILILLPLFFSLFTSAKNLIPLVQPFSWDPFFAELDRSLHGGRQPWEGLHAALGFAYFSIAVSGLYKIWFIVKFGVAYWQAFSLENPRLREQFFLTYMAIWVVLGTVIAMAFSSAGPCYYDRLYPALENPYAGLMLRLREGEAAGTVFDMKAMRYLWDAYAARNNSFFSGISAFPSMHVSVATLVMLLGWRTSKWLGAVFSGFLASTLIGSVYLGWHYAVDGYFSIAATVLLWKLCGIYVDWYHSPKSKASDEDVRQAVRPG